VEDTDCVMNVLSENVKTSRLVSKCLTDSSGACSRTTERFKDTTSHEKVDFGDVLQHHATDASDAECAGVDGLWEYDTLDGDLKKVIQDFTCTDCVKCSEDTVLISNNADEISSLSGSNDRILPKYSSLQQQVNIRNKQHCKCLDLKENNVRQQVGIGHKQCWNCLNRPLHEDVANAENRHNQSPLRSGKKWSGKYRRAGWNSQSDTDIKSKQHRRPPHDSRGRKRGGHACR